MGPIAPKVATAAQERRNTSLAVELASLEELGWGLEQQVREQREELAKTRAEAEAVAAELLDGADELQRAVATLRATEEDLVEARRRQTEVDRQLADLRAAEAKVAEREQLLAAAEERLAALDQRQKELDASLVGPEAELAQKEAEVAARLTTLRERMATAQNMDQTLEQALLEVLEQAGPFRIPPAGTEPPPGGEQPPAEPKAEKPPGGKRP